MSWAAVYEIAEPDLLEEIESVSARISLPEILKGEMENFSGAQLRPSEKSRVRYIDPTYCLEENIYYEKEEGNWEVLYPKGYCFNPIDYVPYDPPPMVVFNPCREEEREWVRKFLKEKRALLIASGCSIREVRKQNWDVPIYYLFPYLKEKLRLQHTISLISVDRERRAIKVEEIKVDTARGEGRASGKGEEGSR
ncbi:MAG TPA: hypothetical protein EYP11_05850 [Aquificaceae bacterium]|nr:hypothetical protein [Aquificaceae bacterium]